MGIAEGVLVKGTVSVHWRPHHPTHPLLLLCNQRYDEWLRDRTQEEALGPQRDAFMTAGAGWLLDFLARRPAEVARPTWAEVAAEYARQYGRPPEVVRPVLRDSQETEPAYRAVPPWCPFEPIVRASEQRKSPPARRRSREPSVQCGLSCPMP